MTLLLALDRPVLWFHAGAVVVWVLLSIFEEKGYIKAETCFVFI